MATATPKRRGRPETPRITELDLRLIMIVDEHGRITVRGVFYQAVGLKLVEKTENAVDLVQRELLKLRRDGRIPFSSIVDESRIVYGRHRYNGLGGLADDVASLYRRDYWANSDVAVQVWVEKRGLAGLLIPIVCDKWGLDLYVAGGQMSDTYIYNGGTEIANSGKNTFVYAMTDFDPGGKTIFNTLKNGSKKAPGGIFRFTEGVPAHVEQIALTGSQVDAWDLPTRPVKVEDKRAKKFIEEHGDRNVELDAIPPARLLELVEDAIRRHMPDRVLDQFKIQEDAEKAIVKDMFADLRQVDEDDEDWN